MPCLRAFQALCLKSLLTVVFSIEDDTCVVPVPPLGQAAIEHPCQRVTLRLMLRVMAFKHGRTHGPGCISRPISAVVGDDEHVVQAGWIVLSLEAPNEIAYHPFLISCADEHCKAVTRAGVAWNERGAEHMEGDECHVGPVERRQCQDCFTHDAKNVSAQETRPPWMMPR